MIDEGTFIYARSHPEYNPRLLYEMHWLIDAKISLGLSTFHLTLIQIN